MVRRIQHALEYALFRMLVWFGQIMPMRMASAMSRVIADLVFLVLRSRRRIACSNVLRCGVADDPREAARIARDSFRHFGVLMIETMKGFSQFAARPWSDFVTVDAPAATMALLRDPSQGVIAVTAHLGNWETAAWMLSSIKPVLAVARPMNNPYVETFVQERTSRSRFRTVPKRTRTAKPLVKALRNGEMLALLADQHARKGVVADFLGVPAMTHTSPARFHIATGAPILVGVCLRTGPMSYRLVMGEPIHAEKTGAADADVLGILNRINAQLETFIRENPGQYLWAHRRWRVEETTDDGG